LIFGVTDDRLVDRAAALWTRQELLRRSTHPTVHRACTHIAATNLTTM